MPKVSLAMEMADYIMQDVDAIHIATCIVKAKTTAACPIDIDGIKTKLEGKFGKPVVVGTHNY
jgi:predicted metal-binding protein